MNHKKRDSTEPRFFHTRLTAELLRQHAHPHRAFAHRITRQRGQLTAALINLMHRDVTGFLAGRNHEAAAVIDVETARLRFGR